MTCRQTAGGLIPGTSEKYMTKKRCNCKEGVFTKDGEEIIIGLGVHNCQYIAQRNALIHGAAELATCKYKITDSRIEPSWWDGKPVEINLWSREFLAQMDKLVRGLGG